MDVDALLNSPPTVIGEDYITDLYSHLSKQKSLRSLYLPHSDVYYVRNAIFQNTGVRLSCREVQALMVEMGWSKR